MTWDVPTAEDCPECGQTLFKRSGKGRMKPFCVNENCSRFLPEDQRGYYKKKTGDNPGEQEEQSPAEAPGEKTTKKTAAKKSAPKKTAAKKPAAKKASAKKTAEKKTAARKPAAKKAAADTGSEAKKRK